MHTQDNVVPRAKSGGKNLNTLRNGLLGSNSRLSQMVAEIRANRRLVFGDVVAAAFSIFGALILANGGSIPASLTPALPILIVLSCVAGLIAFPLSGVYRRHTRSTSLRDVILIVAGAFLSVVLLAALATLTTKTALVPLPVYIIQFLLVVPSLAVLRVAARSRELTRRNKRLIEEQAEKIPALLVGTGASCDLFVRSLRNTNSKYEPVGIIDDARNTQGLFFHDVQIVGSLLDPDNLIERLARCDVLPQRLFLTEPLTHFDSDGIRKLINWSEGHGISVSRLAGLDELSNNTEIDKTGLRTVNPEDILDRPQKAVERSMLRQLFKGRRVLVTGAGGSIGSEMVRQIASFEPTELVMIDNCEFNAYSIDMDLSQNFPDVQTFMYVASIRDAVRINSIFELHRPELVFNAAALKHVPLVELNPCEGVLTNVIGTRNVADAARNVGAIAMVQISTDKAVNTTNVMGATKRVAEFYVQAQDRITSETDEKTRFFSVRFGNVLGSSGSLIPLFQRQISKGGPLTVTDKRMERYFMTIREAVELTLVSAASGLKPDTGHGEIFVLNMGRPVKIVDLAERMIRLAGLEPYKDIDITFVGKRPGEKLYEELFDFSETPHECNIPGVSVARPEGVQISKLRATILKLEKAASLGDDHQAKRLLMGLVPGYGTNGLRSVKMVTPRRVPVPTTSHGRTRREFPLVTHKETQVPRSNQL